MKVRDRSVVAENFAVHTRLNNGVTDACLYNDGNFPSVNDSSMSLDISMANVSTQVLMTEVGILSSGEDLFDVVRIARPISSIVGGGTSVSISEVCLMSNSSGLPMQPTGRCFMAVFLVRIFSTKICANPSDRRVFSSFDRTYRASVRGSMSLKAAHRRRGLSAAATIRSL